ncbi:unnamed protein product [Didymodactylos carnosus]|nr:unnamed protein product [Didymodactylos carnosus]CAF3875050.1 unnamed protein product [Didymodactylos carnosus]
MDGKKNKLLWDEVQQDSKRALDGWKLRNKQLPAPALSVLPDNIDEKTFLNEQVSKELSSILQHWHTHTHHSLDNNQKDTFQKYTDYLFNFSTTSDKAATWLNEQVTLIDLIAKCADDIASYGYYLDIKKAEDPNLKSYDSLIQVFTDLECDQLLDVIVRCVSTHFYTDTLYKLGDINASTLTLTQQFLLVTCPDYILTCDRQKSYCEKLLEHLLPHYTELFDHFLPNIEKWTDTVVLCLLYPIRFILSDSSSFPLDQKLAIQKALIMILFKKSITNSNFEQEHITLVHTVLRVLFQLIRSDSKLLSELKKQTTDNTKLLSILKQLSNDTRNERLQLSALKLLSLLVPEEEFTKTNDAAKATSLIVKNFNDAVEKGKDSTANELLEGLIGMVHSDEVKQQAVDQNLLPSIIQYTKETIDDPAPLKAAYALSFNPDVKNTFSKDKDFIDHVKEMKLSDNIEVTKAAHGVMWKLEDEEKFIKEADEKKADEKQSQEKKSDVKEKLDEKEKDEKLSKEKKEAEDNKDEPEHYDMMISYCWAQKELCHRINDRLEKDGYSVWLDR